MFCFCSREIVRATIKKPPLQRGSPLSPESFFPEGELVNASKIREPLAPTVPATLRTNPPPAPSFGNCAEIFIVAQRVRAPEQRRDRWTRFMPALRECRILPRDLQLQISRVKFNYPAPPFPDRNETTIARSLWDRVIYFAEGGFSRQEVESLMCAFTSLACPFCFFWDKSAGLLGTYRCLAGYLICALTPNDSTR